MERRDHNAPTTTDNNPAKGEAETKGKTQTTNPGTAKAQTIADRTLHATINDQIEDAVWVATTNRIQCKQQHHTDR